MFSDERHEAVKNAWVHDEHRATTITIIKKILILIRLVTPVRTTAAVAAVTAIAPTTITVIIVMVIVTTKMAIVTAAVWPGDSGGRIKFDWRLICFDATTAGRIRSGLVAFARGYYRRIIRRHVAHNCARRLRFKGLLAPALTHVLRVRSSHENAISLESNDDTSAMRIWFETPKNSNG